MKLIKSFLYLSGTYMGMHVFKYLLDSIIKIQWACFLIVTIQYLYSVVCKTIIHILSLYLCLLLYISSRIIYISLIVFT